jgi:hypothetical protein
MGRRDFQEHKIMLFLSKELYLAFIKLQSDRGLGRSYAALTPFVEGLYSLGYISKEVYEVHKQRYSAPLLVQKTLPAVVDREEDQLNKSLGAVFEQWKMLKPQARTHWFNIALQHSELENAKRILALEQEVKG